MTAVQAADLIRKEALGTIFSVRFVKRTTGEIRDMVCRLGVCKGVTGAGLKFDPLEKGLLTVFDVKKNGFRSIPLDAIEKVVIRGVTYTS